MGAVNTVLHNICPNNNGIYDFIFHSLTIAARLTLNFLKKWNTYYSCHNSALKAIALDFNAVTRLKDADHEKQ